MAKDPENCVNHAIFPVSLITETVAILKENGAVFRRPVDSWPEATRLRTRVDYLREFAQWQSGASGWLRFPIWLAKRIGVRGVQRMLRRQRTGAPPAGRPEVYLQHDADRNPENTLAVMEAERALGAVSANYFFRNRASRWEGDIEPYELDIPAMQRLEAQGFEIGYHLNGPELADYDEGKGWELIRDDVAFFRRHFSLKSFVPHGGRPGSKGQNNDHIEHRDCLDDLIWFYNGRGFVCDIGWSDGSLECPASRTLPDPRDVAHQVRGRVRARFLFHPQYYGPHLRTNLKDVGVVETSWWKHLW